MEKTIKAKFSEGVIKPLEETALEEGEEITITILKYPSKTSKTLEALSKSFGGWKGLIDSEELKKNIYDDRLINTRQIPKL